jgi:cytochrome P450
LISSGMHELIRRPELYHQLESSPDQLPLAIEEMLRWTCPLHYFRRTATRDTEIRGQAIAEGERVVMLYSSANFDEEVFDQPMEFDIRRDPNPHPTWPLATVYTCAWGQTWHGWRPGCFSRNFSATSQE